jgi:hypothetical protein
MKTRKTQTMWKMHHPKAAVDRLYVKGRRRKRPATN